MKNSEELFLLGQVKKTIYIYNFCMKISIFFKTIIENSNKLSEKWPCLSKQRIIYNVDHMTKSLIFIKIVKKCTLI